MSIRFEDGLAFATGIRDCAILSHLSIPIAMCADYKDIAAHGTLPERIELLQEIRLDISSPSSQKAGNYAGYEHEKISYFNKDADISEH